MTTICLCLCAISLSLIQISCSKTEAQPNSPNQIITPNQVTTLGKIVFKEEYSAIPTNTMRFSIMNLDGSGVQHLNIPFPAGFSTSSFHHPVLSPDGTKIFFTGSETANTTPGIYSCDTSGANFMRIYDADPAAFDVTVGGAN